MKLRLVKFLAMMAIGLVCFGGLPLRADVGGAILGIVTDPSGAAVAGAKVTLSNPNSGLTRTGVTDDSGSYQFLAVPVGYGYVVGVEAGGFGQSSQSAITLLVNQKYRVDFQLQVGSVVQKIDVSAEAVQVESTSTQVGDVITSSKMTAVPLNGRSFVDLLGLQAGVVPVSSGVSPSRGAGNLSVNGQRETANGYLVNGTSIERSFDNGPSVVPVLDAIEEFRVITSTFDAEYGRFSGGVVNVVTKSGSNSFHGTFFEFLRNDRLDAPGYFDRSQVDPISGAVIPALPKLEQNQFGGTIGGAIKKNRIFFFGDYQGTRTINGDSSGNVSVPTLAERSGDFSNVAAAGYSPLSGIVRTTTSSGSPSNSSLGTMDQVLTQRLGYTVTPGEAYWTAGCNTVADAHAGMCVFPGAIIPQSAWSPAAQGTLSFIPEPTFFSGGTPFFFTNKQHGTSGDDAYEGRVDLSALSTGNWMFYYHRDAGHSDDPFGGGNVPGFPASNLNSNQNSSISNIRNFGPSAVNEARIGFTRSYVASGFPGGPFANISTYGFTEGSLGIVPGAPSQEGLPSINFDQLGLGFGLPDNYSVETNNIYHVSDTFSKVAGKHTVKFGADVRYAQFNIRQKIQQNGVFGFDGSESGNDFGDYLIGAPSSYGQASTGFNQDARTHYFGAFAQDSWKVKPNVTFNYGLRWDISEPFHDTGNRIQSFIPGLQSKVFPNAPTGWVFPGDPGVSKTISKTGYKNFAPRFGLAYSPGFTDGVLAKLFGGPGKTSIRAGTGIYYTTVEEAPLFFELGDAPFGLFYGSPALVYFEEPFKSRTSSNDPGQRFPIPPPGANIDFSPFMPISGSTIVDPRNVLPRTTHYNLNIQRQLTGSAILTLAYVGSQGHHLINAVEANPGIPSKCLVIGALFTAAGNPGGGCGPGGEDSIYTINGQTFNGTRPYSVTSGRELSNGLLDFGGTLPIARTSANSDYNSFQTTLEKRTGRLQLLLAYTYSKSMDNSSTFAQGTNPYDPRLSRSLSAFDVTHNFVVSYAYALPFSRLGHSRAMHTLLDGWAVTGITRFRTGLPVTLNQGGDRSLCGCPIGGVDRPNYDGQPIHFLNPRDSVTNQYFTTDAFSTEQLGVPGNASNRFFHGPRASSTDAALLKDTRIAERFTLQFRGEFFNVFNHALFGNPSGNFNSPNFGRITSAAPGRIGQLALKLSF